MNRQVALASGTRVLCLAVEMFLWTLSLRLSSLQRLKYPFLSARITQFPATLISLALGVVGQLSGVSERTWV